MKVTDGIYSYPWTNMWENNCNSYIFQKNGQQSLLIPALALCAGPAYFSSAGRNQGGDISLVINTTCAS